MGRRGRNAKPTKVRQAPPTLHHPGTRRRRQVLTRAEAVRDFLQGLVITSGNHAGERFQLRAWQWEVIQALYAVDATGHRKVRTAVISMARKGGKTTFAAGLSLCHLVGPESVHRGQVLSAASDRLQASILFREAQAFANADARLAARLNFREMPKDATDDITGSRFLTLSSDARRAHGLSPSFAVADELAMWKGRELLDAIRTGTGAHQEPLTVIISTRSPDVHSPLEEMLSYADDVRSGAIVDPSFISFVYLAPLGCDPFDEAMWRLANPDADDVRIADIRHLADQARRLPSTLPSFMAFCLNMPTSADERWLDAASWDACAGTAELTGPVFAGLDLSAGSRDLTSFCLFAPESKALRVWGFIPEGRIAAAAHEDRAPYIEWSNHGYIVQCPGNVVDRQWLGEWIAQQVDGLELVTVTSDRWLLTDLLQQWDRAGVSLPLSPMGMGFKDQTGCIAAMEALVLSGRLKHGGNPLLRWAVSNIAIAMDAAGNRKADKTRTRGRIDPAIACLLAIGQAERQPAPPDFSFTGLLV